MKRIASLIVALLATLVLAASVSAEPSSATITLDQTDPSVGDTITFTVTGVEHSENPTIRVICWASPRVHVYGREQQIVTPFTLDFYRPAPEGADCTADLLAEALDWNRIARVRFSVSA